MALFIVSFIAGVLTILAPCILPLLPVVLGGSLADARNRARPYVITFSLAISIILFTFLLKATTAFIMIPPSFWNWVSAIILIFFGVTLFFPGLWERLIAKTRVSEASNRVLARGYSNRGTWWSDILIGAALGPIFSTCSPTYFVILATVLPVSFATGTLYLLAYVAGLSLMLIIIALLGQRVVLKLGWATNPRGWFKRALGLLFIILGLLIGLGVEKKIETAILDSGFLDITKVENQIREALTNDEQTTESSQGPYHDFVNPSGFVNSEPFALEDVVGEKVILIDFMTYSCINCQRTFPYLVAWHEAYADDGLLVVGVHTPEFAFERDGENVQQALADFGITFPVVLDNEYETWRAYENHFWPHKYLIDIHGNIVYDHIGEGAYEETEAKIIELLNERKEVLGEEGEVAMEQGEIAVERSVAESPEIYFGAGRNEYLGNGAPGTEGVQEFSRPTSVAPDTLYLEGTWNIAPEHAASLDGDARIIFRYTAKNVFWVAGADVSTSVEVLIDGEPIPETLRGDDVTEDGTVSIQEHTLYQLVAGDVSEEHVLELVIPRGEVQAFTFTFG